jgi:transcription factor STE12
MYPSNGGPMAPPQKPETFMLSNEAQQSLPQDAQVALQQVDNRMSCIARDFAIN